MNTGRKKNKPTGIEILFHDKCIWIMCDDTVVFDFIKLLEWEKKHSPVNYSLLYLKWYNYKTKPFAMYDQENANDIVNSVTKSKFFLYQEGSEDDPCPISAADVHLLLFNEVEVEAPRYSGRQDTGGI